MSKPNFQTRDLLDPNLDIEDYIRRRFVYLLAKELGYTFDNERLTRIGDLARQLKEEGNHPVMCVTGALEIDLLLYGDPQVPVMPFKGFDGILEEIYSEEKKDG